MTLTHQAVSRLLPVLDVTIVQFVPTEPSWHLPSSRPLPASATNQPTNQPASQPASQPVSQPANQRQA
ncbi:unnamed protein product [Protopolystoma xenopodis]|uniref:Uncharacterized protein n=1 Tax=Protopolystoma xenopodis TaxID=117903 RepID=A0A3S4ZX25_9PLAT|nr:unnamed protein product [Protopolystoma xenopodis]